MADREPGAGNRDPAVSTEGYSFEDPAPDDFNGFEASGASGPFSDHRELDVWKLSMDFAVEIYRVTRSFPSEERFGLTSQLRRAAFSIPLNIAEGYGRETSGAYLQFLRIAQGSAKEIQTALDLSGRLGLIASPALSTLNASSERISQMLYKLIRAIERRK